MQIFSLEVKQESVFLVPGSLWWTNLSSYIGERLHCLHAGTWGLEKVAKDLRILCSYSLFLKAVAGQGQCPTTRELGGSANSPERMADVLASVSGAFGWGTAVAGAHVL